MLGATILDLIDFRGFITDTLHSYMNVWNAVSYIVATGNLTIKQEILNLTDLGFISIITFDISIMIITTINLLKQMFWAFSLLVEGYTSF